MTVNQETDNPLTPNEVREIIAYVRTYRPSGAPFDVGVNGETPADLHQGAAIVQPYQEAGATWWIEYDASRGSFEEYRELIRQGPPKT